MEDVGMSALSQIIQGEKFPYDNGVRVRDWAHRAARGVIADLQDRHTIKHGFDNVDEETRVEIVESLSEIIRAAHKKYGGQ